MISESIVEDAALKWFEELGCEVGYMPQLAPGQMATERDSLSEVQLEGHLREAIQRLNTAIPSRPLAIFSDTLLPKLPSRGLCMVAASSTIKGFV